MNPVARFDPRLPGMKAPLRDLFFTGRNLTIGYHDRVEADAFDSIRNKVHARAVVRLICISGRIHKETGLIFVIPFGMAAGDALLLALIEDDVAIGYYL